VGPRLHACSVNFSVSDDPFDGLDQQLSFGLLDAIGGTVDGVVWRDPDR
jgi:hypothetical protein